MLGVILFLMVYGTHPFKYARRDDKQYYDIQRELYLQYWSSIEEHSSVMVDDGLKQLITMMIQKDESARPSIQDIMTHPWMEGFEQLDYPEKMLKRFT